MAKKTARGKKTSALSMGTVTTRERTVPKRKYVDLRGAFTQSVRQLREKVRRDKQKLTKYERILKIWGMKNLNKER